MAKKQKPDPVEDDDSPAAKERDSDKRLLLELRERYTKCVEHDRDNRDKYRANMRFALVPGEQWDSAVKNDRGKDRVMYEFNLIRIKGKAIVNQIRANRPAAKITPAEEGDVELAEAMKAQVDQIQNSCDADAVMDYAVHHQVFGGMGAERYLTAWQEDSVDGQDILIEPVQNPMCLYADYACQKQDKSDARFWIYASKMPKETFKAKYKNAKPVDFEMDDDFNDDCEDNQVWVAEYWKEKPIVRRLALLSDGKTVDMATIKALPEGVKIIKERNAPGREICQYICSGNAVLEDETGAKEHPWAGKFFPFNVLYGEYTVIDGKVYWCGITEYGKDAQRAHNWATTSVFETIASTPQQSTTWVTAEQAKDNLKQWDEAQRKNFPYRVFNPDPKQPGAPSPSQPAAVPAALIAASQMSGDSLKAVLGMPDEALGEKGSTNSGIAIRRRQEAGAVANFNYGDNATNFARRRTEILIDLIPKVKDTPYTLRVIGKDGAEKYVKLNEIDPVTGNKLNDLSALKYDLVVTQGPNFATQRQEAAETYMGMQQTNPQLGLVAGDLIMKNLDLPGSQEIAERLKATLPAPIQAMLNKDNPVDPQVAAAMQQVEQQAQMLQEQAKVIDEETQALQAEQGKDIKAKADLQVQQANIKTAEAQLAQKVAEFKTLVAETEARFAQLDAKAATEQSQQENQAERAQLAEQLTQAVQAIQEQSAQLAEQYAQQLAQVSQKQIQEATAPQPKRAKVARTKRVNGNFVTTVTDAETGQVLHEIPTQRMNGELVTQMNTVQ